MTQPPEGQGRNVWQAWVKERGSGTGCSQQVFATLQAQLSDTTYCAAAAAAAAALLVDCLCVTVRGDYVIVGDLMKSVTLLFYKAAEGALEVRVCV
jgi:hypothetical protein